jgi:hypothetical protein
MTSCRVTIPHIGLIAGIVIQHPTGEMHHQCAESKETNMKNRIIKHILTAVLICFTGGLLYATSYEKIEKIGIVTYKSSQNVYVKFENTLGITQGDTLYQKTGGNLIPVMVVQFISTKSVAGQTIGTVDLQVDDKLYAVIEKEIPDIAPPENKVPEPGINAPGTLSINTKSNYNSQKSRETGFSGKFSVQSYSNISNSAYFADNQRWRYSLALNAKNIGGSSLSFSDYMTFAYRADQWSGIPSNFGRSLRVYDLALNYEFSPKTSIWAGRHLNRKITNISSVDGLQFETGFNENYAGLVAGSRPNFTDLGFNLKLFEYGAYVGRDDSLGYGYMSNTAAFFEQTNDFKTDRRFLYFQHSNSLIPNTNIFLSTEVDMFKMISGVKKNQFQLTSLFASVRYSPSRVISFSLSYDARKNVIYYETFKNFIDSVFENETRQGFNARINIRPLNRVFVGLNGGYRFQKTDIKPARNFGGYISYSQIPAIEVTPTVSYTKLITSYIEGGVAGLRLSRSIGNYFDFSVYYRNTRYKFYSAIGDLNQNSLSADLSTILLNPVFLSVSYEGIFEEKSTSGRILLDLTTRF